MLHYVALGAYAGVLCMWDASLALYGLSSNQISNKTHNHTNKHIYLCRHTALKWNRAFQYRFRSSDCGGDGVAICM